MATCRARGAQQRKVAPDPFGTMLAPIGTLLGLIVGDVGIGCGAWSRVTGCSRPLSRRVRRQLVSLHCTLIITAEHEQLYVFVGRVHQSVEVAALQHRE